MLEQLAPIKYEEKEGEAEIRVIFKSSRLGKIAGCQVLSGNITRKSKLKLRRDNAIIWEGNMDSMKRGNDEIVTAKAGTDCGIILEGFDQIEKDDIIEAFTIKYEKQTL